MMSPDSPQTPREELEVRLTALLMGELSESEATEVRAKMAADPELAALHAGLKQAVELLREANAMPEAAAAPAPAKLSSERRERLFAHFKKEKEAATPAPAIIVLPPPQKRDWKWMVPLSIAASLVALIGGTFVMKSFVSKPAAMADYDFSSGDGDFDSVSGAIMPEQKAKEHYAYWGERGSRSDDSITTESTSSFRLMRPRGAAKPSDSLGRAETRSLPVTPTTPTEFEKNEPLPAPRSVTVISGTRAEIPLRPPAATPAPAMPFAAAAPIVPPATMPAEPTGAVAETAAADTKSSGGIAFSNRGEVAQTQEPPQRPPSRRQPIFLGGASGGGSGGIAGRGRNAPGGEPSAQRVTSNPAGPGSSAPASAAEPLFAGGAVLGNRSDSDAFAFPYVPPAPAVVTGVATASEGTWGDGILNGVAPSKPASVPAQLGLNFTAPDGAKPADSRAPMLGDIPVTGSLFTRNPTPASGPAPAAAPTAATATTDEFLGKALASDGTAGWFGRDQAARGFASLNDREEGKPNAAGAKKGAEPYDISEPLSSAGRVAFDPLKMPVVESDGVSEPLTSAGRVVLRRSLAPFGVEGVDAPTQFSVDSTKGKKDAIDDLAKREAGAAAISDPQANHFFDTNGYAIVGKDMKSSLDEASKLTAAKDAPATIARQPEGEKTATAATAAKAALAKPALQPEPPALVPGDASSRKFAEAADRLDMYAAKPVELETLQEEPRLLAAKQAQETALGIAPDRDAQITRFSKDAKGLSQAGQVPSQASTTKVAEIKKALQGIEPVSADPSVNSGEVARTKAKLQSIVIPKIDFRETTVREALAFLEKKSAELDTKESDPAKKGVDLKFKDSSPVATSVSASPVPAVPAIPGLEPLPAPSDSAPAFGGVSPEDARISLSLSNVPMAEALKYVTSLANLKYKFDSNGISVGPISTNTESLIQKEYKVPAGFGSRLQSTTNGHVDAVDFLKKVGVTFPEGAGAVYVPESNQLIIRNTEENLYFIDSAIAEDTESSQKSEATDTPPSKPSQPAPTPQPEVSTQENAFSTFSLNVSDVAFKLAAASLEQGKMPEPSTLRTEEFINAFDYHDPEATPGAPLAFASERARYPFAQNRDLLRLSVKTAAAGRQPGRPLNIVLLLDNSGSMERADRVRIVREALRVLSAQLQAEDKLSVITFARTAHLWIDGVSGDQAGKATERAEEITPQGGTNIAEALRLGYETARKHYQPGSINRVVLLTDGAANLGDVNPDALKEKVEANRRQGIALDCFGIGWEGYDDRMLETLARNGDGRYGFVNTPEQAATEFAGQLAGALRVAASDVKVQVEFNPRRVTAYRQVGYAKHQLTKEQFRDNTVDAAEIGAAESGNALYVVEVNPHGEGALATVRVRFKVPGTADYREQEWTVPFLGPVPSLDEAGPAMRLAGTSAAFAEWLASSPYATEVTPDQLLGLINGVPAAYSADPRPAKLEWMIRQAKNVSGR